jgi:hypothetical protein
MAEMLIEIGKYERIKQLGIKVLSVLILKA